MSWLPDLPEPDRALAQRINNEALVDPKSPYAGKFVGIANGRVVIVSNNLDEVDEALERAEPDSTKTFFFEAGVDYENAEELWEMR
jgi:hypothetical protein